MLNMKAMPAANGGRQATYLWNEAAGLSSDIEAEVLREDLEYYATLVDGLVLSLDANGLPNYRDAIKRLRDPGELGPEMFEQIAYGMRDVFLVDGQSGWAQAIDQIVAAWEIVQDAEDRAFEVEQRMAELPPNELGVEYRADTAPDLA